MWENMVEPNRTQKTIRCMRFACWITKATYTQCVILTAFPLQNSYANAPQIIRKLPLLFIYLLAAKSLTNAQNIFGIQKLHTRVNLSISGPIMRMKEKKT